MARVPGGISVLASIGSLYVGNTGDPTKGYEKLLVTRARSASDRWLSRTVGNSWELTFKKWRATVPAIWQHADPFHNILRDKPGGCG
jgi:hypothetical protein